MIASLVATLLAVTALGITTFLSFRYGNAVRSHEQAALARYKGIEDEAAQREREAVAARERVATLEREIAATRDRAAMIEQQVAAAREQAAEFEKAAREATERATQAATESKPAPESARAPLFDAAEIRRRFADLGKLVRDATTRPPESMPAPAPGPEAASDPGPCASRCRGARPAAVPVCCGPAEIRRHASRDLPARPDFRRACHRCDAVGRSHSGRMVAADMDVGRRGRDLRRRRARP